MSDETEIPEEVVVAVSLLIIPSIIVTFSLLVPLTGVLVRFRANYNPKGLQLDAEGAAAPHTGPVITSYFSMFKRVWRLEGWAGLYKGFMPTLVSTFVMAAFILLFLDSPRPHHGAYKSPQTSILGTFLYSLIGMIVGLPATIITYRAITTPHRLPWFAPLKSLRILLTPTERRKPWILYLTPGLMASEVSHILVVVLFLSPIRSLLLPDPSSPDALKNVSSWKLAIYVVVSVLATAALVPLEVIGTRLAIQRNHASAEYNSVRQEADGSGDSEEIPLEYAGAEEDVIGLRNEEDPYVGLVDCAKRIVDEEGLQALYRAWWITLLGILLTPV